MRSFYCHSICLYKCHCDFSWVSYDSVSLNYPAWKHPESERQLLDSYRQIHHLVSQDPLPRREIPACTNTKLPPRTGAAAAGHTLLRNDEPLQCPCLSGLLWGTSFHDKAQNNFPPPQHTPQWPKHVLKHQLVSFISDMKQFCICQEQKILE